LRRHLKDRIVCGIYMLSCTSEQAAGKLPRYGDPHRLHHCQKGENAAQCDNKGTSDNFSPSAPSILSNFIQAYFDRLVLSQ